MVHRKQRLDLESEDTEKGDAQFLDDAKRVLDASSVVIDVGANRGQFALKLLQKIDLRAIYCFEPVPDAFAQLEILAASDSRILPVQAAVSTERSTIPFFVTKSDVGSSMLRPNSGQPSQWLTLQEEIVVEAVRLDEFIQSKIVDHSLSIDLLKTDAQGADKAVLESAGVELSPQRIRSVLVEVNFSEFYAGQDKYTEILELLDRRGYRPARIYPHRAHDDWLWWADVLFIAK